MAAFKMDIWVKKYGGLELINLSKISSIVNERNEIIFYVAQPNFLKGEWATWKYEDNETGRRLQKEDFSRLSELLQCKVSNRPWGFKND